MEKKIINAERVSLYPATDEITLAHRPLLHPLFKTHQQGISEFTFADIWLFRKTHNYRITRLADGLLFFTGRDVDKPFFIMPFGLPSKETLDVLFTRFAFMKCASETVAARMSGLGYEAAPDAANFDYLYLREEQSELAGRRFHGRKNLVNLFSSSYSCVAKPLLEANVNAALIVLDDWRGVRDEPGDYEAAKEALLNMDELALCGGIYYVDGRPAAYVLGEELSPEVFAIHFEKGLTRYKGLLQYVNRNFAGILPSKYRFINREQDLGDVGLKHSKQSYRPIGFVKKYRVSKKTRTNA